jgi:hypothetical protein
MEIWRIMMEKPERDKVNIKDYDYCPITGISELISYLEHNPIHDDYTDICIQALKDVREKILSDIRTDKYISKG